MALSLTDQTHILDHAPNQIAGLSLKSVYWTGSLLEITGLAIQAISIGVNASGSTIATGTGLGVMGLGITVISVLEGYLANHIRSEEIDWDYKKISAVAVRGLGGIVLMAGFGTTIYGLASGDRHLQVVGVSLSGAGMLLGQLGTLLIAKG